MAVVALSGTRLTAAPMLKASRLMDREDVGLPVSRPLPSPEWSGAGDPEAAQTPTQPCIISLLQAPPPPLLLFICLITKQKLQSNLLYFFVCEMILLPRPAGCTL